MSARKPAQRCLECGPCQEYILAPANAGRCTRRPAKASAPYTPASIEAAAKEAGVRLEPLTHRLWSVLGVGMLAVLSLDSDRGFRYRAKAGKRWKVWKRGKRLGPVLEEILRDADQEASRLAKYEVAEG